MRMLAEALSCAGRNLLLLEKAKFCDTAQACPLRPTPHSLWLTIQFRSQPICPQPHSAAHCGKDRYDEKQPRRQACAPLSHERLASHRPQNHSNFSTVDCPFKPETGQCEIRGRRNGAGHGCYARLTLRDHCPTLRGGGTESDCWPLVLSESFNTGRSCARSWSNCFVTSSSSRFSVSM